MQCLRKTNPKSHSWPSASRRHNRTRLLQDQKLRLITTILGIVLVGGCNGGGGNRAMPVQTRLESAVASGATTFDFAADPAFNWDRMYVLDCYSSRESAEKVLNFSWPEFSKTTIESSDSVVLVVFVENRKVVGWFEQPRRIELGAIANEKGYARSEAGFKIKQTAGRVELKPQSSVSRAGDNQSSNQGDD